MVLYKNCVENGVVKNNLGEIRIESNIKNFRGITEQY